MSGGNDDSRATREIDPGMLAAVLEGDNRDTREIDPTQLADLVERSAPEPVAAAHPRTTKPSEPAPAIAQPPTGRRLHYDQMRAITKPPEEPTRRRWDLIAIGLFLVMASLVVYLLATR